MIWTTLVLTVLLTLLISLYASVKGGLFSHAGEQYAIAAQDIASQVDPAVGAQNEDEKEQFAIFAYISWFLFFLMVIMVVFLQSKVKISIGIIREASKAIKRMPFLVTFPLVTFIMTFLVFIWFCVISAFIYSMGSFTVSDVSQQAEAVAANAVDAANQAGASVTSNVTEVAKITMSAYASEDIKDYSLAYHFFIFLWTVQLIQAIGMCSIAGAVCRWYWSRDKSVEEIGRFPIWRSFKNCFRYHFGSLCFGSLVIAIVQFIRYCLMYLDQKTKGLQEKNILLKIAMKVVQCCVCCLEKCLKFITRNAYILVAMKGKSFCSATVDAFTLILSNIAQIGVIGTVSFIILLLAKITITTGCGYLMFLYVDNDAQYQSGGVNELSAPIIPVLCTVLVAWAISSAFMNVYDLTIDTILLCFCCDKKKNSAGEYYMSEELQKYIGDFKKPGKDDKEDHANDKEETSK